MDFKGQKVLVMGLGLFGGGVGVTKFLVKQGARVTVTDLRPASQLKEALKSLEKIKGITYHLGGHRIADFQKADLIVVNPAVPLDSKFLKIAKRHNIPLETEINLFFKYCPCSIVGITGSNGKTTTATLLAEILKNSGQKTWLGGNIGKGSLLEVVHQISSKDIVVLELSSFQLETVAWIKKSPFISIVLNIRPNHLDRHKTMENYINAKKNIIRYQTENDWAILNLDDPEVKLWSLECKSKVVFFSRKKEVREGGFIKSGAFYLKLGKVRRRICSVSRTKLPGEFNQENILAAITVAGILEVPISNMSKVITSFSGVEHRLEFVGTINGVKYYNDSIATNPESTIAALKTIKGPIILIAGGYDKQLPMDELAEAICQYVKKVILLGQTAPKIKMLLQSRPKPPEIIEVANLPEAVEKANQIAHKGDTVLFSPACASYDMFRNFVERGNLFKETVFKLASK